MELDRPRNPWSRKRRATQRTGHGYKGPRHSFNEMFGNLAEDNIYLDVDTKRAALIASPFVVSLVSHTGGKAFFWGSGTIIECEDVDGAYLSTVLTSASLLRSPSESNAIADDIKIDVCFSDGKLFEGHVFTYDFHYNFATIKIKSDAAMPTASVRRLDDSISIDRSKESFQLQPHSELFHLCPGEAVVAVGRYYKKPYYIMAASGKFSLASFEFDCRELLTVNCKISKCGIGGPLINYHGEVIGVNFYEKLCTPFLPINLVSKCLEQFKAYGKFCRPRLGVEMINLYSASLGMLEKIIEKVPNISKGVLVEKVTKGSPAESAGLFFGDVIVQCDNIIVRSLLELHDIIFDKVGKSVELAVIREGGAHLKLDMMVEETGPDEFNRWPLPEEIKIHRARLVN